jgi:hypothetical protein
MIYKGFKDIRLSALGMGNMRLPQLPDGSIDEAAGQEIIDYCMENGVNYYDTAFIYHDGKSEEFLGKALKKYDRNSFYVADKFNLQALPDYRKQFEIQLEKL